MQRVVKHYMNGRWTDEEQLVVPVKDLSVARGFGVFDFLQTYDGVPFRLDAHIKRFFNSAGLLGLKPSITPAELEDVVAQGLSMNPKAEYAIRMTLTGGVSEDFITPGTGSLIVAFYDAHYPTQAQYKDGVKVITTLHVRHLPEAKSLNYLAGVIAQRDAREQGAIEALYVNPVNLEIYEGTTTNVFAVKDGIVITPSKDILKGITRQVVFELCTQAGITCREDTLYVPDIKTYDEMFITSSSREVLPVVQVDGQTVGGGKVGAVSKRLRELFHDLAMRESGGPAQLLKQ